MTETICKQDKIAVTVLFNTVKIEISCASNYEARVLFDDLVARFEAGEEVSIVPIGCEVAA
jgi:hypothetical protein